MLYIDLRIRYLVAYYRATIVRCILISGSDTLFFVVFRAIIVDGHLSGNWPITSQEWSGPIGIGNL